MAEQIGLEAVLQDADFQAGLKRYLAGVAQMDGNTARAAKGMTLTWDAESNRWRNALGQFATSAEMAESGVSDATGKMSKKSKSVFDEIASSMSGVKNGFVALGDSVWDFAGQVGNAVVIAGVSISGLAALVTTSALDIAGDYQASMNVLQATTGASSTQMAAMSVLAKQLGADMTLPATSAADAGVAMTEMAKAGLQVNDIMAASRGVLQLAAAANITNSEAAMITVNALKAFNLEGSRATQIADLLTAAATSSGSSVGEMGDAFQMGAAVANQAGVSIEDFTTMLAEMSQAGIKGADSGTSIKTMLLKLIAPTDAAKEEMKKLGVNIYDTDGKMRSITDIMANLNTALYGTSTAMATVGGRTAEQEARLKTFMSTQKSLVTQYEKLAAGVTGAAMSEDKRRAKLAELAWEINQAGIKIGELNGIQGTSIQVTKELTEAERNASLMEIFQSDAIRAAIVVAGGGSKAFDDMRDKVTKSGKAADMAGARMRGFKGALAGLKSQAETALLAFGEPMLGPLEDFARSIAGIFENPAMMAGIAAWGESIGAEVGKALDFVAKIIKGFRIGGIVGVAGILDLPPEQVDKVRGFVNRINEAFGKLKEFWDKNGAGISAGIGSVVTAIAKIAATAISVAFLEFGNWLVENGPTIAQTVQDLGKFMSENSDAILGFISGLAIAAGIAAGVSALSGAIGLIASPAGIAVLALGGLTLGLEQYGEKILGADAKTATFADKVKVGFWGILNDASNTVAMLGAIIEFKFWETLNNAANTITTMGVIINFKFWETLNNAYITLVTIGAIIEFKFWETLNNAYLTLVDIGAVIEFKFWETLNNAYNTLVDIGAIIELKFWQTLTNAYNTLVTIGKTIEFKFWETLNNMSKFATELLDRIKTKFDTVIAAISLALHTAFYEAFEWAKKNVLGPFIDGLNFILGLIGDIRDAISGLKNALAGVKLPGASGGGSTPTDEYQEGGYVPRTGPAVIHAGEFVLSKAMLKELSSILSAQATMSQAMVQGVSGGANVNNTRVINVTVNPTYENYQSPSAVRYDVSAALMAAGV